MAKEMTLSGCAASAQAVKMAKVDVICSYPIRPYTAAMMELAKMVAEGELDAEFIHGEGEHAQLSVVYGASAAGARTFTGSSGVGVTYAMEVYSPISGARLPVQMMIADRALDPPGDFGSEHTDAMSCRDQGWIMGWAESPQEAFDNHLINYRIGEDPRVMLAHPGQGADPGPGPSRRVLAALQPRQARPGSQAAGIPRSADSPRPRSDHGSAAGRGIP